MRCKITHYSVTYPDGPHARWGPEIVDWPVEWVKRYEEMGWAIPIGTYPKEEKQESKEKPKKQQGKEKITEGPRKIERRARPS